MTLKLSIKENVLQYVNSCSLFFPNRSERLNSLCHLLTVSQYRCIQCRWGGGELIDTEGLFNLETTMVSVLHKELENKVEKLFDKCKKVLGHAAEDQN